MTQVLEYRGYIGSVELDLKEGFAFGKLLYLRDVVSYQSQDITKLEDAFRAAVDDYINTCRELGDQPDAPCKGSLNVRIGPDLHRRAAIAADREGVSLNDWIRRACALQLQGAQHTSDPQHVSRRERVFSSVDEQEYVFAGAAEWQNQVNRPH